jgi:Bacterial archaeo-eukaryotic release factor family 7
VSVYMPTHSTPGREARQDLIRFKNLLRASERHLIDDGLKAHEAARLLQPAVSRLADTNFWRHQSSGLAAFLSIKTESFYRLPLDFSEELVVGERFYVRPLLRLFMGDGRFYVLALSQSGVRLLKGSRNTIREIEMRNAPSNLAETLADGTLDKQLQYHVGTPERGAMFHGHGPDTGQRKDLILRYFRHIDVCLETVLRNQSAPLLLAGVAYYFPIYRAANSYPYLLSEGIPGNPEDQSLKELHEKAWKLVENYFSEERRKDASRYRELVGTGRTSNDLSEIAEAAGHGRVGVLFTLPFERAREPLGRTSPAQKEIDRRQGIRRMPIEEEDLMESSTAQTLLNGGRIHEIGSDELPGNSPIAAILRY